MTPDFPTTPHPSFLQSHCSQETVCGSAKQPSLGPDLGLGNSGRGRGDPARPRTAAPGKGVPAAHRARAALGGRGVTWQESCW